MELRDDKALKTSFEKAFERAQKLSLMKFKKAGNPTFVEDNHEDHIDNSFVTSNDNSIFVEDDRSKHVDYGVFNAGESKPLNFNSPVLKETSDSAEDLTFPKLPDVDFTDYDVKVHYTGPMFDYGGYAKMNRTLIFGLKDHGALVKTVPMESITNVNYKTETALRSLSTIKLPTKYPKIFAMTIPDVLAHGGRKILYTMMETSNHVHKEYAERLNLADEIWTPTTWCRDVFKNSGVYSDIHVMPLGVDTLKYVPGIEPIKLNGSIRSFVFLCSSGWSYRKGFDVVIRAYLEEFSNKEDVSLVLSTRFSGSLSLKHKQKIIDDFKYFRSLVNKKDNDLPHVALHSAYLPESDMPKLYNAANCFILISRGEGWGLPYCEAGSCEIPVIASDHGGQRDFLDNNNSYLVPPDSYFVSKTTDPPFKNMAWISHFYENQEFPDYNGESFELVKNHMRRVFENYDEAKKKAKMLRQKMVEKYSWSSVIDSAYERLKEICSGIDRPL